MKEAESEIKATLTWLSEETERIGARLEAGGKTAGLDSNPGAYTYLHKEFARRMKAIGEKYGLIQENKTPHVAAKENT